MRFYPDSFPEYWMEPSKKDFDIVDISHTVGVGVKALRSFKKGQELFRFTGTLSSKVTQYSLTISNGMHIHDPWFMGRVLHSCDPNCTVDMQEMSFTALRDINEHEMVTMNYNETEGILFKSFNCDCGFSKCLKHVGGYNDKLEPDNIKIERLLLENNWRFAKTLAHIPHFYSRGKEWDNFDDFVWACDHIQQNSSKGNFSPTGKYVYNYFNLGKWKYWVMERDKPSNQQILINRAFIGHSYSKDVKL